MNKEFTSFEFKNIASPRPTGYDHWLRQKVIDDIMLRTAIPPRHMMLLAPPPKIFTTTRRLPWYYRIPLIGKDLLWYHIEQLDWEAPNKKK